MKPSLKVQKRLAGRIAAWENDYKSNKTQMHKPGSQNRKK